MNQKTEAARILKGHRNHRNQADLFDAEGNVVLEGADSTAEALMIEHERPIYVNRQSTKTITTSDGRVRKTFDGFYLSLTSGEQTVKAFTPEGWVEPEPEETGKMAKEQRESIALAAKVALADLVASLTEDTDEDVTERIAQMVAAWARRIPGEGWDERLPQA